MWRFQCVAVGKLAQEIHCQNIHFKWEIRFNIKSNRNPCFSLKINWEFRSHTLAGDSTAYFTQNMIAYEQALAPTDRLRDALFMDSDGCKCLCKKKCENNEK